MNVPDRLQCNSDAGYPGGVALSGAADGLPGAQELAND